VFDFNRHAAESEIKLTPQFGSLFVEGSWGRARFRGKSYQMNGMWIKHPSEHSVTKTSIFMISSGMKEHTLMLKYR